MHLIGYAFIIRVNFFVMEAGYHLVLRQLPCYNLVSDGSRRRSENEVRIKPFYHFL